MVALAWIGTVIFFVLAMACTSLTFATWFNLPNDRFTGPRLCPPCVLGPFLCRPQIQMGH